MNILIVGLGSIGQRHLRNIKLIKPNANLYTLREKNKNYIIKNQQIFKKKDILKYYKINKVSYNDLKRLKIDASFICNPSAFHMKHAIYFLKKNSHIFIEKPLGGSISDLKKLIKLNKKYKRVISIGYQFRFHPLIKFTKNLLKKNQFGKIISAKFNNLSFLPHYHKYEDYRKGYAAKKKLGGSVIDTQMHEVDLIAYFFGVPNKIIKKENKTGILKSDVNDVFDGMFLYDYEKDFNVNVSLSLSSTIKKRNFEILFKKVLLKCDLIKNKIELISNFNGKILKKVICKKDINNFYIAEVKNFFNNFKKKFPGFNTLEENLNTEMLYHKLKS